MPDEVLRHSVRGLIVDPSDRILLGRHALADGSAIWAAPGGGVEKEESVQDALRRELREEVGLVLEADPPLVWRQVVRGVGLSAGYSGIANDYFLVRTAAFEPRGELSDTELALEKIEDVRWWSIADLAACRGVDLFSPRDLAVRLATLLQAGVPAEPTRLAL